MRALWLFGLAGCSSIFGFKSPVLIDGASGDDDAPVDTAGDSRSIDAQQCFGTGEYAVCFDALPADPTTISGPLATGVDGAPGSSCVTTVHWVSPNQPAACFVVGTDVTVGPATPTGRLPLVIVATGNLTFAGLVDLSSHRGMAMLGAGSASAAQCGIPGSAEIGNNGGGGGAGGTFGTLGGGGGSGDSGVAGATPAPLAPIDVLHGGCPGVVGARGGGGLPTTPGPGGGALYAVAGGAIHLGSATVAANGAGAMAPQNRYGGPGGGTGGMIVLSAATITSNGAILVANGGGGASGLGGGGGGTPGADPDPAQPVAAAPGGVAISEATGGNGFAGGTAAMAGAPGSGASGAGGGGGGGYIRTSVAITGNVTSSPGNVVGP